MTTRDLRRFSYLTTEDLAILHTLDETASRAFEAFIRAQHRADAQYSSHEEPRAPHSSGQLESASGARQASNYGTGGGRRRHPIPQVNE